MPVNFAGTPTSVGPNGYVWGLIDDARNIYGWVAGGSGGTGSQG